MGLFHLPKPGTLDDLLWRAFVAGVAWEAGGPDSCPRWDDKRYYEDSTQGQEVLGDFDSWRTGISDPDLLPWAQEPVPFPWDER